MKTYNFKINGKEYSVTVKGIEGRNAEVSVNGCDYTVEMEDTSGITPAPVPAPQAPSLSEPKPEQQAPAPASGGSGCVVHSPLPGVIISIDVKEGQAVRKGQKVAVLEAMKMENEIQAEADGTVSAILVQKGDSVLEGAEIIKLS